MTLLKNFSPIYDPLKNMAAMRGGFLAHLSTTCSRGAFRVTGCPSCVVNNSLNINNFLTAEPIWTKLGRNVPWEVLFKNCSQNLILSKTLVAMATKWNFLANSLKIFSSETAGRIFKLFHRDVPWVTLFKKFVKI